MGSKKWVKFRLFQTFLVFFRADCGLKTCFRFMLDQFYTVLFHSRGRFMDSFMLCSFFPFFSRFSLQPYFMFLTLLFCVVLSRVVWGSGWVTRTPPPHTHTHWGVDGDFLVKQSPGPHRVLRPQRRRWGPVVLADEANWVCRHFVQAKREISWKMKNVKF